ncbi:hypothetical protein Q4485_08280 [Granulosicoccaceae sp. 1_MG-2023]|nr:hypothetical protein [Granulosicoccaceae sp. 1_MG-2023]
MADSFNLIPPVYERRRSLAADLRRFLILVLLLLIAAAALRLVLEQSLSGHRREAGLLHEQRLRLTEKEDALAELQEREKELQRQAVVLRGLRGDLSAQRILRVLDSALSPGLYFDALLFERSGEPVMAEDVKAGSSYFIRIPERSVGLQSAFDAVQVSAGMTISGQADSHTLLGQFMSALNADATVARVELLRSDAPGRAGGRVHFELMVLFQPVAEGAS